MTYTNNSGISCDYCSIVDAYPTAVIVGTVFYDLDQDGLHDIDEAGIPNQIVGTDTWGYGYTDSSGIYSITVGLETHTLQFDAYAWNPAAWTITNTGGNALVVNATDTITYANNNFGIYVDPNYHDVGLYSWSDFPVPGFESSAWYMVYNNGINTENVTLTIDYDPLLQYVSSDVTPTTVNTTDHQLVYEFSTPAGYSYITVSYQCPTTAVLSTPVVDSATVAIAGNTDVDLSNNVAVAQGIVVGSFDPNDKAVTPAGVNDNHAINPNHVDELTYRIRFQNTGSAPAHFIVIKDTIDVTKLDITTLRLLDYTHDCHIDITEGNILTAYFDDIMLPDSNANEPESHGAFTFAIKLLENLPDFTQITNKAYIYFDYNAPVITNDAFVTLDQHLAVSEAAVSNSVLLYPNPVNNALVVKRQLNSNCSYQITDVAGRTLNFGTLAPSTNLIDVSDLTNGAYGIRIIEGPNTTVRKFVVLHQ